VIADDVVVLAVNCSKVVSACVVLVDFVVVVKVVSDRAAVVETVLT